MSINPDNYARYKALADNAAARNGIPAQIFENLVGVETGGSWDPYKIGLMGEIGLTQLMPNVVNQYNINAYDPGENLQAGAAYLAQIYTGLGSGATWAQALSAYNSGSPTSDVGKSYAAQVLSGVTLAGNQIGAPVNLAAADGPLPDSGATGALTALWGFIGKLNDQAGLALDPATRGSQPNIVERLLGVGDGQSTDATKAAAAATNPSGTTIKYVVAFLVVGVTVIIGFKMLATPAARAGASFIPGRASARG